MSRLGLLGGTFDPVHLGHLALADTAQRALGLTAIRLLPSRLPPHRPDAPAASAYHRFAMLALAVADRPGWGVSDAELLRDGPSYTFDTLTALGAMGHDPLQLVFIIGADAFAEIATWSRYPAVLDLAHFAVVARPGHTVAAVRDALPQLEPRVLEPSALDGATRPGLLYLQSDTPAVSSTVIRRRAAEGQSLEGLVPPAVAAHIHRHQLYSSVPLPSR